MTLKIISAEDIIFQGETSAVTLPGEKGEFTVLNHHASMVSTLVAGTIRYTTDEGQLTLPVSGGLADIDHNVVSVCIY